MSHHVEMLIRSKKCGGIYRKAILLAYAARCNDDGSGAIVSKSRIAEEIECSRQTVHDTVEKLIKDGFLRWAKKKSMGHGYVVQYDLLLPKILCLPDAVSLKRPELDTYSEIAPSAQDQTVNCPELDSEVPASGHRSVQQADTCLAQVPLSSAAADASVPASVPAPASGWRADPWMVRIFEVAGPGLESPDKNYNVWLDLSGRLPLWRANGWDLETDIVPVITAKTAKPRAKGPMYTFRFLETDIAAYRARRAEPIAKLEPAHEGHFQGYGESAGAAGGTAGRQVHGSGAGPARSGYQPRSGNLAASKARVQRMREEAAGVSDQSKDWRDDWVA